MYIQKPAVEWRNYNRAKPASSENIHVIFVPGWIYFFPGLIAWWCLSSSQFDLMIMYQMPRFIDQPTTLTYQPTFYCLLKSKSVNPSQLIILHVSPKSISGRARHMPPP